MTDRQKFAIAALLIVSAVLGLGWITADHWLPIAQAIIVSGGRMTIKQAALSAAIGAAVGTVIGYLCALATLYWIAERTL